LNHRNSHLDSTSRHRSDHGLSFSIISNGSARGADPRSDRGIGYDATSPDTIYQIIVAHEVATSLRQRDQEIENLRLDMDRLAKSLEMST
jgi:hypothetical protein